MKTRLLIALGLAGLAFNSYAGADYQSGTISNLTVTTDGVMITLDAGVPDNCSGTPYGYMLVRQDFTALTSVLIASWVSGKKTGTVYTYGKEKDGGYCMINQWDPAENQ